MKPVTDKSSSKMLIFKMRKNCIFVLIIILAAIRVSAYDLTFQDYEGSLTPYPIADGVAEYPDSLIPVFISHVGRHGSRYPASDTHCMTLRKALLRAQSLGTITPLGEQLNRVNEEIIRCSANRWGALDSLGKAEQYGIGERMARNFPSVFTESADIVAYSSYSPRSIESMEACLQGLTSADCSIKYKASSGKQYNELIRPFDVDQQYIDFIKVKKPWEPPYRKYFNAAAPFAPIRRVLGEDYPFKDEAEAQELSLIEYYVLAGCSAMSLPSCLDTFFTYQEAEALWSCFNLRQYLQRTATSVSTVPAEIAKPLAYDIISSIDDHIASDTLRVGAVLRFGHGETILPLVSLLHFPRCYYITDDFETVATHWKDYFIIPMAANVQFVLFRAKNSGQYYLRVYLNEKPVQFAIEGKGDIIEWQTLRAYLYSILSSASNIN